MVTEDDYYCVVVMCSGTLLNSLINHSKCFGSLHTIFHIDHKFIFFISSLDVFYSFFMPCCTG